MTEKKAPASTGATNERNTKKFNSQQRHYTGRGKECKIEVYTEGMRMTAPSSGFKGMPDHLKGTTRGEVKGWSYASRKAMREWLLTHETREGIDCFAVTFTVPGPALDREDWERLWNTFGVYLRRLKGGAVWRKEVQSRDAVHWHCLVGMPREVSEIRNLQELITVIPPEDPNGTLSQRIPGHHAPDYIDLYKAMLQPKSWERASERDRQINQVMSDGVWPSVLKIYRLWFRCLDTLGPVVHQGKYGQVQEVDSRSELFGADRYSVEVSPMSDEKKGWNRYMLDHTTKAKQEQIAEHKGRHWGVINRKCFDELEPAESEPLTWKQYSKFLRAYNRLITPYVRHEGAMFGKVKGRSFRRGVYGQYVAFTNPETCKRLTEWAKA